MGSFDEAICEFPMPRGYEFMQNRIWQTKSFDCNFHTHKILESGILVCWNCWWSCNGDDDELSLEDARLSNYTGIFDMHDFEFESDGLRPRNLISLSGEFQNGVLCWIAPWIDENEERMSHSTVITLERRTHVEDIQLCRSFLNDISYREYGTAW